jgi:hypothetical protein
MWWIPMSRCAIAASLAERARAGASAPARLVGYEQPLVEPQEGQT